jgi:hypothetical protein
MISARVPGHRPSRPISGKRESVSQNFTLLSVYHDHGW